MKQGQCWWNKVNVDELLKQNVLCDFYYDNFQYIINIEMEIPFQPFDELL